MNFQLGSFARGSSEVAVLGCDRGMLECLDQCTRDDSHVTFYDCRSDKRKLLTSFINYKKYKNTVCMPLPKQTTPLVQETILLQSCVSYWMTKLRDL